MRPSGSTKFLPSMRTSGLGLRGGRDETEQDQESDEEAHDGTVAGQ